VRWSDSGKVPAKKSAHGGGKRIAAKVAEFPPEPPRADALSNTLDSAATDDADLSDLFDEARLLRLDWRAAMSSLVGAVDGLSRRLTFGRRQGRAALLNAVTREIPRAFEVALREARLRGGSERGSAREYR
jgi:hypothetical protein